MNEKDTSIIRMGFDLELEGLGSVAFHFGIDSPATGFSGSHVFPEDEELDPDVGHSYSFYLRTEGEDDKEFSVSNLNIVNGNGDVWIPLKMSG